MSDQLGAAAQALGIPEAIVERSARARAEASGQSYEDVLAAWAGGEAVAAPAPTEAQTSEPAEPATEPPTETPAPEETPQPATPATPAEAPRPAAVGPPPAPARVSPEEALEHPVVVTVPTAGIKERTAFSMPVWLGVLLLILPAFGLIHLALGASTSCGTGTNLRVDRVSGIVQNCDGSPFEGRGAGGGGVDYVGQGQEIYANCAGCHGPQGQGQGAFPALTSILNVFSSCSDHIEWVTLGSAGFTAAGRTTFGDNNQPVNGGMPTWGDQLSDEQIAEVVAFERVRLAGGNQDQVLADCGLVQPTETTVAGVGGGGSTETTVAGQSATTETTSGAEATASH